MGELSQREPTAAGPTGRPNSDESVLSADDLRLMRPRPPDYQAERDALVALMPKLNLGDVVVLIENHSADAAKTAAEFLKKAKEVNEAMSRRQLRPPPPAPR